LKKHVINLMNEKTVIVFVIFVWRKYDNVNAIQDMTKCFELLICDRGNLIYLTNHFWSNDEMITD